MPVFRVEKNKGYTVMGNSTCEGVPPRYNGHIGSVLAGVGRKNSCLSPNYNGQKMQENQYGIKEVRAPDGYVMSGSPQIVEIREGKPAQVEFVNSRKESLQILKVDAETGDPLPEAVFTVTKTSGEPVGDRYTTDRSGSILITDLEPGAYIVREVQAPEGYILSAAPQTVQLIIP